MKRIAATLGFLAIVLAACGEPNDDPQAAVPAHTSTPLPETPASPPQLPSTPTATPGPVITSSGWLVHRRDGQAYASPLDGSAEVMLDAGFVAPELAPYAGYARVDGETWLYMLAPKAHVPGQAQGEARYQVALTRTSLATGRSEAVYALPDPFFLVGYRSGYTSVSPDGARFAHATERGIEIVALNDSAGDLLIPNECASPGSERCPHYAAPLFSPRGDAMLVMQQLYEGSRLVYVDLDDPAHPVVFEDVSGDVKTWSSDGERFCAYADIFVPGGTWVFETDTLERRNWDEVISPPTGVQGSGCALNGDMLALSFFRDLNGRGVRRIAFVQLLEHGAGIGDVAAPNGCSNVDGWLPGNEGLIVSTYPGCEGAGEHGPQVLLADGTFRALPFEAGEVLAIVP